MFAVMEDSAQKESVPQYWECATCRNWVVTYTTLTQQPTCNNPRHSTKVVAMVNKDMPKGVLKRQ